MLFKHPAIPPVWLPLELREGEAMNALIKVFMKSTIRTSELEDLFNPTLLSSCFTLSNKENNLFFSLSDRLLILR
jgi:hypothetical protein